MSALWVGPLLGLVAAAAVLVVVRRRLAAQVAALGREQAELDELLGDLHEAVASLRALPTPIEGADRSPSTRQ